MRLKQNLTTGDLFDDSIVIWELTVLQTRHRSCQLDVEVSKGLSGYGDLTAQLRSSSTIEWKSRAPSDQQEIIRGVPSP